MLFRSLFRPDLSLCLLSSSSRLQLLATSLALGIGRIGWAPGVGHLTVPSLHVEGPRGEPVQADGDIVAHLPAAFQLSPEPLLFR